MAKIKLGLQEKMYLGNVDAKRDWGHAKDYVEGMWRMLQQDVADDYVLATGDTTTVRDFVTMAFAEVDIQIEWSGEGIDEVAKEKGSGKTLVSIDPRYFRPTEVELLVGDPTKARTELGWKHTYDLKALVKEMVEADVKLFQRDKYLLDGGHQVMNYNE